MKIIIKLLQLTVAVSVLAFACSCGSSGSGGGLPGSGGSLGGGPSGAGAGSGVGTGSNVAQLFVDAGPLIGGQPIGANDIAYVTVTVCVPGTTNCQNIDHVQVDTGSEGLRILANQQSGTPLLTVPLPQQALSGNTTFECTQFVDTTFLWGPVATADISIGGETAKSVPVQIALGANSTPAVPADCGNPTNQITDIFSLDANAIIGLGVFKQDCGINCTLSAIPGTYYLCNSTGCSNTTQSAANQVQNPVPFFASDNNGTIIQLPSVPDSGQSSAIGSLIFGIGTQSNNGLGNAGVVQVDPNQGFFTVNFQGSPFVDNNYIDSGSNGYFFLDSATLQNNFGVANIPDCPSSSVAQGFYCPGSQISFSASVIGNTANGTPTGAARTVNFNVGNADTLINSPSTAFNNLGGPSSGNFDFGLPFFFGKTVFTAIENQPTPAGNGPYVAF